MRHKLNIIAVAFFVISFSFFQLGIILYNHGSIYGTILLWIVLALPLIGIILALFGQRSFLKGIAIIGNIIALVFCTFLAYLAIFASVGH